MKKTVLDYSKLRTLQDKTQGFYLELRREGKSHRTAMRIVIAYVATNVAWDRLPTE